MTREEHQIIIGFIAETLRQDESDEAPLDVEADAIIRALFVRNPEAAYHVTRLAIAQRDELDALKVELAAFRDAAQAGWLSRLLNRRTLDRRVRHREDPNFALVPQDLRRG